MEVHRIEGGAFFHTIRRPGWQVVLVTKPGCAACRSVRVAIAAMPARENEWVGEVNLEDAPGLVEEFDIFHLPTVLLFEGGEWVSEVSAPIARLRHVLDQAEGALE